MFSLAVFLLLLFPVAQSGDLPGTFFLNPPAAGTEGFFVEDNVYQIGVPIDVQWQTNFTEYTVYLWGQIPSVNNAFLDGTPIFTKSTEDEEKGGFSWNVTTGSFSLTNGTYHTNIYFMSLGDGDPLGTTATCHYFNVTDQVVASQITTTTQSSSASSTNSPTPTDSSAQAATTTPTSTKSSSPETTSTSPTSDSSKSKSSSGLAIGLGVGLGIGFILLCSLFVGRKIYQRQKQRSIKNQAPVTALGGEQAKYSGVPQMEDVSGSTPWKSELPTGYNLAELPTTTEPAELPER